MFLDEGEEMATGVDIVDESKESALQAMIASQTFVVDVSTNNFLYISAVMFICFFLFIWM